MMPIPGITAAPLLIKPGDSAPPISDRFNVSLWTGTSAARTITTGIDSGEGALVWSKSRSAGNVHILIDTVRGAGNYLSTNATAANAFNANSITSFSSTGYSLANFGALNGSGTTQVGWQFRRAEKFFDIVQYTGNSAENRQIAHSLGEKPGMIIIKQTSAVRDWLVYQQACGAGLVCNLNGTSAFSGSGGMWGDTEPNAGSFYIGSSPSINQTGQTYIAYLFGHDPSPEGIIQCGSYAGNGSATGPVVNLGWRPQYLMIKNATDTGDWQIIDAQRGFTATNDAILLSNTNGNETSSNLANPNSTGFQVASSVSNVNTSGQTYVYMAIREA